MKPLELAVAAVVAIAIAATIADTASGKVPTAERPSDSVELAESPRLTVRPGPGG